MAAPTHVPDVPLPTSRVTAEDIQNAYDQFSCDADDHAFESLPPERFHRICEWLSGTPPKKTPAATCARHTSERDASIAVRGLQANSESEEDFYTGLNTPSSLRHDLEPSELVYPGAQASGIIAATSTIEDQQEPNLFTCGICQDELPRDLVTVVNGCDHRFCVECMRNHVIKQVEQKKYPIPCPSCKANSTPSGTFSISSLSAPLALNVAQSCVAATSKMSLGFPPILATS